MGKCTNCGADMGKEAKFCGRCGHKKETVKCRACGAEMTEEMPHCSRCGMAREDSKLISADRIRRQSAMMQGEETIDTTDESEITEKDDEIGNEIQDNKDETVCDIDATQRIKAVYSTDPEEIETIEAELVEDEEEIEQQATQGEIVPIEIHPDIIVDEDKPQESLGVLFGAAMASIKEMIKNRKFNSDAPEIKAFFTALGYAFKTNRAFQIGAAAFVIIIALLAFMPDSKSVQDDMQNETAVSETDEAKEAEFKIQVKAIAAESKRLHGDLENILSIIDNDNRETIAAQLVQMKSDLDRLQEKLYRLVPPGEEQERIKERFLERLEHERNLVLALIDVCNDPLGGNANARLSEANKAIDEINRLNDEDGTAITQRVAKMQEMVAKERAFDAKRQAMRKFVAEANTLLWKYSDQEATMNDLLGKADSKRFKSGRYLGEVESFIAEREALLREVDRVRTPDGNRGVMKNLKEAIRTSIKCCNTMKSIANESLTYNERKAIYKKVTNIHNDSKRALYLFKTDLEPYKEYAQ